ncbi:PepSY domain-containing protein [Methyloferula stellata]|uniref:PepSY domain-containing protein n=1 Tax=Methyloferula stellata TaxID=876270 RepID=UPI00036CEAE4|nr:PepSY domain-containing protein [Methyloferula stellata]
MKVLALALVAWTLSCALAACADQERQRVCFSAQETREKIREHKLSEPFRVLKSTASQMQAEAIGVKLCRWKEELVYEISLLRRDGHILHVFVNAADGHTIGSRNVP